MTIQTSELAGRTVMVVGAAGTGKTAWSRALVAQLAQEAGPVALVSADMGQQSVGVPTCLALADNEQLDRARAMWFVGDVSPGGNLLPTVVGTARLVHLARSQGAQTVIIDTTGLTDTPAGRVLKYHKALAAGVDCVVAVQRPKDSDRAIGLLKCVCPAVYPVEVRPGAKDRTAVERRWLRQERYRKYFQEAAGLSLDAARLVGTDWMPNPLAKGNFPAPDSVVGLLDGQGFCLGIGVLEKILPNRLVVHTPWSDAAAVVSLKLGLLRLNRQADYAEAR